VKLLVVKHSQFCVLCAAAAAAAANAVKSVPEAPSLPSPPSLPNPTEALKSTSDAASKLSLPEAPSVTSVGQDSSALQQVTSLFCMSLISRCMIFASLQSLAVRILNLGRIAQAVCLNHTIDALAIVLLACLTKICVEHVL